MFVILHRRNIIILYFLSQAVILCVSMFREHLSVQLWPFDVAASSTSYNVMVSFRLNLYNHLTRKLNFNA